MTLVPISDGSGTLTRHADFPSQYIAARNVDVWVPPGYARHSAVRYPVVYMHDGQNLFDPGLVSTGVDWGMDEAVTRLIERGQTAGAIVVGIWNSPLRWRDYMPARPLAGPAGQALATRFKEAFATRNEATRAGPVLSDMYLKFLVTELKPFVDRAYRTRPEQPHTLLMGASMGALISLYALLEYPQVFGGAGCLSTHWPVGGSELVTALGLALPRPGRHKLYFDYGTEALDAQYEPFQRQMDECVQAAGYRDGQDWLTRKFSGAGHTEQAWRERVDLPLAFLLGLPAG